VLSKAIDQKCSVFVHFPSGLLFPFPVNLIQSYSKGSGYKFSLTFSHFMMRFFGSVSYRQYNTGYEPQKDFNLALLVDYPFVMLMGVQ
jgi:hypothetical protein